MTGSKMKGADLKKSFLFSQLESGKLGSGGMNVSSAYESLLLEMSLIQAEHHLSQGDDNNKGIQTGER